MHDFFISILQWLRGIFRASANVIVYGKKFRCEVEMKVTAERHFMCKIRLAWKMMLSGSRGN